MNYQCPVCGHPHIIGRLMRESFLFGEKLVDYPFEHKCRSCSSSWEAVARVDGKNKTIYSKIDFIKIVENEKWDKNKTWQEQFLKSR